MLYYFGYLTLKEDVGNNFLKFVIPNKVIDKIYNDYYASGLKLNGPAINNAITEIANTGKIDLLNDMVKEIFKNYDSRLLNKFDEKYIVLNYNTILSNSTMFNIWLEYPLNKGYADIFIGKIPGKSNYDVILEFKYIKVSNYDDKELKKIRAEAIEQVNTYAKDERLNKSTLKKYIVIFVGSKLKICEEIM